MKKQLNVDLIQNELKGGSAFFPGYEGAVSPTPAAKEPERGELAVQSSERPNARTPASSFARTPVRDTTKRIITRNSFEIYEDQMDSLRKLSFKDKMDGKIGSMSAMVREAIDKYLEDHPADK